MSRKKKHSWASKRKRRVIPEYVGKAMMSREGFVFVRVDGEEEDIFVKASKTRGALHGDTVRVAVTGERTRGARRRSGEIIAVLERSQKPFVGVYHSVKNQAWVLMSSKTMPFDIEVKPRKDAQNGMKVAAVVDGWERGETTPHGHITDILGFPGENETEMYAILAQYALPYSFPQEVEAEADAIVIKPADRKGREDFSKVLTFTIDPADAKDFDDAISFRELPGGNIEVGVHIADVSWFVRPGTLIDREACARGTSVYLVDRTVPMLPERLSNNLCSLRPGEEKLTFSAVFELTPTARVLKKRFCRSIIVSDHRLDYSQAQTILDAPLDESAEDATLAYALHTINKLAKKLRKKRFAAGAVNFDRPEMKVEVDADGRPIGVYEKIATESNHLIEEFMLLANRSVAEFMASLKKEFVYRIHDVPNPDKLDGLMDFSRHYGYKGDSVNDILKASAGKPEHEAIMMLALRSMAKACYSTDNIGHYGLAFRYYTHFTSPIRRYPDMMVHRLLADALKESKTPYLTPETDLQGLCRHCSERETLAAEAERDSVKYKLVEFMQDKVGQEFDGHVSGITEWGIYVEIEPTKIEGMVPYRTIRKDFFIYDEEHYRAFGRRSHRCIRLGDPVRIKVASTSLEQRLLDYTLVE